MGRGASRAAAILAVLAIGIGAHGQDNTTPESLPAPRPAGGMVPYAPPGLYTESIPSPVNQDRYAPSPAGAPTNAASSTADANGPAANGPVSLVSRSTSFEIPFSVEQMDAAIVEVQLYVSANQGASWQLYSRQPPAAGRFLFRAGTDGEFWFASRTVDSARRANPDGKLQAEQIVVVDTAQPQLEFHLQNGPAGELQADWKAYDMTLEPRSIKLEYQAGPGSPWQPISIDAPQDNVDRRNLSGRASWYPAEVGSTLTVRAEIQDRAGNKAVTVQQIAVPKVARRDAAPNGLQANASNGNSPPSDPNAGRPAASLGAMAWMPESSIPGSAGVDSAIESGTSPVDRGSLGGAPAYVDRGRDPSAPGATAAAPAFGPSPRDARYGDSFADMPRRIPATPASGPLPETTTPTTSPATNSPPNSLGGDASRSDPSSSTSRDLVNPSASQAFTSSRDSATRWNGIPTQPPVAGQVQPRVASSLPRSDATAGWAVELPAGVRPEMTNLRMLSLDYDVQAVGSQGVADVELWVTRDGGRRWDRWGADEDRQSPLKVEVDRDGIYGFRIVVVGQNGLASRPPQPGDLADLWVGVDTTSPQAKIVSATYGEGNRVGQLIIRWDVNDVRLADRPVTLSFSDRPDGPWTPIAAGIPNSGEYAWPADPRLPERIHLRIEAKDAAGNVGVDQLADPIAVEGLTPRGHIRGFQPVRPSNETNGGSRTSRSPATTPARLQRVR